MSEKLEEFRRQVANLKRRAEELQLLKSDIDQLMKLRKKLAATGVD